MKKSQCRAFRHALCIVCLAVLWAANCAWAQTGGGIIRGQVTDPSNASVAGATVLLTTPTGASMDTTTNKDGVFEFKDLAPGKYQLKAVAQGFALFTKADVIVTAGQVTRANIALQLEVQEQKVEVQSTTTQLDVNPANNANTIVLQGKDLDALSDDPDELQSQLEALAGPSAGPNGGQIYIDGFTGGQLPPKASIREIRINQNPFSAEYDKLGYGRIEILTKPGTNQFHGQFLFDVNDQPFNAQNPFVSTVPPYHTFLFSGNVSGPITKKASFFFDAERRNIGDAAIVNAVVLGCVDQPVNCPTNFTPTPFTSAISNPKTRTSV